MPTEVYPARMAHHDPYHDTSAAGFAPLPAMMGGWSSMPATGPARSIDCLPRQYPYHNGGRILPGGLRNPWAPYSGETYAPASDGAENIRLGAASAYGSLANVTGRTIGGGGSVIHPVQIGGGGSVVTGISGLTGRSVPSIGLGGLRNDDGWDGSVGRVHAGFSPDLTSTAGAIPRIAQSSHWLQSPSSPISPMNHARLTPILAPPPVYPVFAPGSLDRERARHPIDATRPKRIPSVKYRATNPGAGSCVECSRCGCCGSSTGSASSDKGAKLERSRSRSREGELKEAGSPGSVLRKNAKSPLIRSSLRPKEPERPKGEAKSHRGRSPSLVSGGQCAECAG